MTKFNKLFTFKIKHTRFSTIFIVREGNHHMYKINFKQPKYIFPLVIFVPLCALVYFVMQTFSGGEETAGTVATDRINMELPQEIGRAHV